MSELTYEEIVPQIQLFVCQARINMVGFLSQVVFEGHEPSGAFHKELNNLTRDLEAKMNSYCLGHPEEYEELDWNEVSSYLEGVMHEVNGGGLPQLHVSTATSSSNWYRLIVFFPGSLISPEINYKINEAMNTLGPFLQEHFQNHGVDISGLRGSGEDILAKLLRGIDLSGAEEDES